MIIYNLKNVILPLYTFLHIYWQLYKVVRKSLGDANEENIRSFYKSLVDAKHVVGGDLQRNVYRNYTEFVSISKEISNLDADVLRIKEYLNELKSIWESFLQMTQDDHQTTQSSKREKKKSYSRLTCFRPYYSSW